MICSKSATCPISPSCTFLFPAFFHMFASDFWPSITGLRVRCYLRTSSDEPIPPMEAIAERVRNGYEHDGSGPCFTRECHCDWRASGEDYVGLILNQFRCEHANPIDATARPRNVDFDMTVGPTKISDCAGRRLLFCSGSLGAVYCNTQIQGTG